MSSRPLTALPAPAWSPAAGRPVWTALQLLLPAAAATLAGPILARAGGRGLEPAGLLLLACGATFAYLHDRLEPGRRAADRRAGERRETALRRLEGALLGLGALAAAVGLATFLAAGATARLAALVLAVVALLYPLLARLPLGKTLAVAACWQGAAVLLPSGAGGSALVEPAAIGLFLTVAAASVLCDLKDRRADAAAGVRSLPVLAGRRGALGFAAAAALAAAAFAATAGSWPLAGAGLGTALLAARPAWLEHEIGGPLLVDGWLVVSLAAGLLA